MLARSNHVRSGDVQWTLEPATISSGSNDC